jgi:hypothetical protein
MVVLTNFLFANTLAPNSGSAIKQPQSDDASFRDEKQ